jgi:hypothetical protein
MLLEICNTPTGTTVQAVADSVYSNSHSMSRQWASSSLNTASMEWSGRAADVIRTVKLPCSVFPDSRRCDFDLWNSWIAANAAPLGLPLSSYQYHVLIAPVQSCAIGFAAGSQSFVRSDWVPDLNVWKHEVGHMLGLRHASAVSEEGKAVEYGDYSSPMVSEAAKYICAVPCAESGAAPATAVPSGSLHGRDNPTRSARVIVIPAPPAGPLRALHVQRPAAAAAGLGHPPGHAGP